jgi:hypothetical protein|tara:strand:+ start:313 stop:804 length:492 start_codon:yes stop_codon:yes gene_type:complete
MNTTNKNTKAAKEQTAREAQAALDAKGSTLAPEPTALDKLKQQAAGKVYATGGTANLAGTYEVVNADDPRWSKLFDVLTRQCGKLAREMVLRLDNNNQIVIDDKEAAIIAKSLVHKSETNTVIETYLPMLLGAKWSKNRGNQKMRDVVKEGVEFSFAMFKRIS